MQSFNVLAKIKQKKGKTKHKPNRKSPAKTPPAPSEKREGRGQGSVCRALLGAARRRRDKFIYIYTYIPYIYNMCDMNA
jgi:hypothetical protein